MSVKGKKCFCTDSFSAYMLKGQKQRGKGVDNNILAKKSHEVGEVQKFTKRVERVIRVQSLKKIILRI